MAYDAMNARQGKFANARQHGGDHYQGSEYQHWDWVHDVKLGYLAGNATKYAFRWRKKNGIEDLEKAIHYIDKAQERGCAGSLAGGRSEKFWKFVRANSHLTMSDASALWYIMEGQWALARDILAASLSQTRQS